MMRTAWSGALVLMLAGAAGAQTDSKTSPLEAATASKADQPVTVSKGQGVTSDADILRLVKMLTGSFVSEAKGETPALRYNAASVSVGGLDNAVMFEITRADNPAEPFRVGIMHAYRRKGELRLRVFDLTGNPGLKETLVGLWAAPEAFPKVDLSSLTPNVDMPLKGEPDNGFAGDTTQPFPTTRDGAIELTSSLRVGKDMVAFGDAGFDADGKQVWGVPGGERVMFKRTEASPVTVQKLEGGLVVITLVPPGKDAEKVGPGGEISVHYTGWLSTGAQFDTSHKGAGEPFRLRIPGGVIKGWNEGLKDVAKGERRRLVIPPALGYGERGAGRGLIPPNATLVFDVECVYVDNTQPAQPAQPPTPTIPPPHGPNPPGAAPQQPTGQPIGTPPSGGTPEKPR